MFYTRSQAFDIYSNNIIGQCRLADDKSKVEKSYMCSRRACSMLSVQCGKREDMKKGGIAWTFFITKEMNFLHNCTLHLLFNKIDIILSSPAEALYAKNLVCICIV